MCRLAAYLGPPISLEQFLIAPEHSLINQAWRPREMREATLNADGFGIGWFADDNRPACYKNTRPIWSDANIHSLGRSLVRQQWMASVRSATLVNDISHANTQPFYSDLVLFAHNGYLEQFTSHWRGQIRRMLQPEFENMIHGTTDSEYVFALFKQHFRQQGDAVSAVQSTIRELDQMANGSRALLNIMVALPGQLVATRHAINGESPTLYYSVEESEQGHGVTIASEALFDTDDWIKVDENQLLVINRKANVSMRPL